MFELKNKYSEYEWFHSIEVKNNKIILYVNYLNREILDLVSEKDILIHYASSILPERYTEEDEVDLLNNEIKDLLFSLGKEKITNIFFEIHDGDDSVTELSNIYPKERNRLEKLYEEYGFDVLFDLLEA